MTAPTIPQNPDNDWRVTETYDSGGPKTYRNRVTGETLSTYQYKSLKRNGFRTPHVESLDASPAPEAPPPPPQQNMPPRASERGASGAEGEGEGYEYKGKGKWSGEAPKGDGTLWAALLPGLYLTARGLGGFACNRLGYPDVIDYVPPIEVATEILQPASRIMDRHIPLHVNMEATADGKDLLLIFAGVGKLVEYWSAVDAAHQEEYARYAEEQGLADDLAEAEAENYGGPEQPKRPAGPTGRGDEQPAPTTGRADSRRRNQGAGRATAREAVARLRAFRRATTADTQSDTPQRSWLARDGSEGGSSTNGATPAPQYDSRTGNDGTARAAASIRYLRELDAYGRARSGLG